MLKKGVIAGLVLLVAGSSMLGYLLGVQKKEQQLAASYRNKHASRIEECLERYNQWLETPSENRTLLPWGLDESGKALSPAQIKIEQRERLGADLEKLAAGEKDIHPFADQIYGKNWRSELQAYKKQKESREIASVASLVAAALGGLIVVFCSVFMMFQNVLVKFYPALISITCFYKNIFKGKNKKIEDGQLHEQNTSVKRKKEKHENVRNNKLQTILGDSWRDLSLDVSDEPDPSFDKSMQPLEEVESVVAGSTKTEPSGQIQESPKETVPENPPSQSQKNEKDYESFSSAGDEEEVQEEQVELTQSSEPSYQVETNFKSTEWSEKDLECDGQLALSVKQAAEEKPSEISDTLKQLTQQVSAIREYASDQQVKFKKLQAGYDWKIIKSFCLRIIRCIDNIESRIAQLSQEGVDTVCLEEVRDELLFSLESSGVEQFRPELKSEYRGLEKSTEVIKEREPAPKPKLKGRIAKIVRAGYQYCLNEDKIKVVRTAQVKIYD
jgi:molecular chaperone GrpE (heat shock protein)